MILYYALGDLAHADYFHGIIKNIAPEFAPINVLVSYTYIQGKMPVLKQLKKEGKILSTFLDAATYSMNPGGANPDIENKFYEYLSWIEQVGEHFDFISSYDARFNEPMYNMLSYERLRSELRVYDAQNGTHLESKVVPVIHSPNDGRYGFTPAEEFLGYLHRGAKTIGIGSKPMVNNQGMADIMELSHKYNARIHRFGNFGFRFLVKWNIASADSARIYQTTMHEKSAWFWDTAGEKPKPVCWNLRNLPMPDRYMDVLNKFGWSVNDLIDHPEYIWTINVYAHQQVQQYLTNTFAI